MFKKTKKSFTNYSFCQSLTFLNFFLLQSLVLLIEQYLKIKLYFNRERTFSSWQKCYFSIYG